MTEVRTDSNTGNSGQRGALDDWPGAFVRFVGDLVRRPRWRDHPLPLVRLDGPGTGAADAIGAVERAQRVHGVRIGTEHDTDEIRSFLDLLHHELATGQSRPKRLRFGHYTLLTWVMDQSLTAGPDATLDELAGLLRESHRRSPRADQDRAGPKIADFLPLWARILWRIFGFLARGAAFRAAISGRIPGIGPIYRWFMTQQYLAPKQSTTFLAFAERLTKENNTGEDPEQVEKLLVHAFLRDLRRAYSRLPWRLRGWRRTAYPLVMIDGVADPTDVRYRFVRRLGEVSNETARFKPLLVVYAGERPPAETAEPHVLDDAYESWAEALPKARRKREPSAWVLPLRPPEQAATGGVVPRITAPKPPFFSRPVFVIAVAVVVCASLAAWGVAKSGGLGCPHRPFHGAVSVRQIGGECVGYSDSAAFKFNDEPGQTALRNIQDRIFAQNRQAGDDWRLSGRRRPYVTLVYLGTLTGRAVRPDEEAYAAEREELEGLAVAQYDGLREPGSAYGKPLLHVVIANGGFQMRYVHQATDMVADLARHDPTVAGVVGLVESRQDTATALTELNKKGLLAIAPNLSADYLYQKSKLYLQVVPPNRDQARMVAEYARRVLKVSGTHIYYSVGDDATLDSDLYVSTLRQGLIREFGAGHDRLYTGGASLSQECGYQGMLFFAGRWSDFPNFLDGLKRDCVNDMPAHLVADDSVNRYMANTTIRPDAPGNLALTYVSKAALATCDRLQDRMATDGTSSRFLRWVQAPKLLDPPRCLGSGGLPVGERVGLAYDSTMMVLQSVEALAARVHGGVARPWDSHAVSSVAIYTEILRQNAGTPFPGVTGAIKFNPQNPGEPVNKRLALVHVRSIPDLTTAPAEVFHCGVGVLDGRASSSASGCTR